VEGFDQLRPGRFAARGKIADMAHSWIFEQAVEKANANRRGESPDGNDDVAF
jgi:hypothetical protein